MNSDFEQKVAEATKRSGLVRCWAVGQQVRSQAPNNYSHATAKVVLCIVGGVHERWPQGLQDYVTNLRAFVGAPFVNVVVIVDQVNEATHSKIRGSSGVCQQRNDGDRAFIANTPQGSEGVPDWRAVGPCGNHNVRQQRNYAASVLAFPIKIGTDLLFSKQISVHKRDKWLPLPFSGGKSDRLQGLIPNPVGKKWICVRPNLCQSGFCALLRFVLGRISEEVEPVRQWFAFVFGLRRASGERECNCSHTQNQADRVYFPLPSHGRIRARASYSSRVFSGGSV